MRKRSQWHFRLNRFQQNSVFGDISAKNLQFTFAFWGGNFFAVNDLK